MRTFTLLSIIALAAAGDLEQQGDCVVDGAEAVSDLMDSTMFIWASIQRCGDHAGTGGQEVRCEIAISSAIESVNSMINVILKAVDKCGDLHGKNKKCGLAAGRLTKSIAGLAAASGGIAEKCPHAPGNKGALTWNKNSMQTPMCVVNLKNSAKSLFKAIKALMKVKNNCEVGLSRKCASNGLKIVGAFAGLGEYLAGTVGQCTSGSTHEDIKCDEQIQRLVKETTQVAQAGIDLSKACEAEVPAIAAAAQIVEVQVPRLYEQDAQQVNTPSASANLMLGAFLPVTAIVSFVGGRFYANRQARVEQTREFMSDNE